MNVIEHFEVPHLALWKSCVAEVLARENGKANTTAFGIDTDHPMMKATDIYCKAMESNTPLKDPGKECSDKETVEAYLSYLHHRKAHAKIADHAEYEATLEKQIAEYKFGNPLWQQMFIQYYKYYWQYAFHKGKSPKYRSWKKEGKGNLQYGVIEWVLPSLQGLQSLVILEQELMKLLRY